MPCFKESFHFECRIFIKFYSDQIPITRVVKAPEHLIIDLPTQTQGVQERKINGQVDLDQERLFQIGG